MHHGFGPRLWASLGCTPTVDAATTVARAIKTRRMSLSWRFSQRNQPWLLHETNPGGRPLLRRRLNFSHWRDAEGDRAHEAAEQAFWVAAKSQTTQITT
jgi:hypothetical protein